MRTQVFTACIGALFLASLATEGRGQSSTSGRVVQGMFGTRTLGAPLRPMPRGFGGGIATGYAGEFQGRSRSNGAMMFNSSPLPITGIAPPRPPLWSPRASSYYPPLATEIPPVPSQVASQPQRAPVSMPPREQWFGAPGEAEASLAPPVGATPGEAAPAGGENVATAAGSTEAASGGQPAAPPALPGPPRLTVGFPSAPATTEPGAVLSSIFDRSAQVRTAKRWPVTVTMQGETAVLRGRVATDHDRLLAEALAQMQPGIWKVQNELVVESPASPAAGKGP